MSIGTPTNSLPFSARTSCCLRTGFDLILFLSLMSPTPIPAADRPPETSTGRDPGRRAAVATRRAGTDTCLLTAGPSVCYARYMSVSDQELLHHLSRIPFADTAELAMITGQAHVAVHRALADLLTDGIVARFSHGTSHLPPSRRYYLTARGIREAAQILGFDTASDYVRAYPVSQEWLTLLVRRMDAVASMYRMAATISPGVDGLCSQVDFQRRGRFDAVITRHDGLTFGVVRQGLALRRRSLYDRLRAIAEYGYRRRPGTVLVLTPSVWEQRLTTRFCMDLNIDDCYVAVESRDALEDQSSKAWRYASWVFGSVSYSLEFISSHGSPNRGRFTEPRERKRASLPDPEQMVSSAPAFGLSPAEKRTLDLITDHPLLPREHLARWLGVSEGRVSQMLHGLVKTWVLVERRGKKGEARYTLSEEGIRYVTHRDRAQLPTTRGIWSTELITDKHGRRRRLGHRIETWERQTRHVDGITWFLSELAAEARSTADSDLTWSIPTAKTDRAFNWGESAIAPDAVGHLLAGGLHVPFYLEHELRARHPKGVLARLNPYIRYYHSNAPGEDMAPFPVTLFVVASEEVEETYVRTASQMNLMTLPILVSSADTLALRGLLGRSWRPLWESRSPRLALSGLRAYGWDSLRHRVRPIGGSSHRGTSNRG